MSQLLPCPSCSRHVRRSESGCPFCGSALALEGVPERAQPMQRLGRAATFAFGAAIATSVAGCGGATTPGTDSGIAPAYGAPADTGMPTADMGTPGNDSGMLAMYGGPPIDAGSDAGNTAPAYGAPADDAGGPAPAYGAVPAPDSGA